MVIGDLISKRVDISSLILPLSSVRFNTFNLLGQVFFVNKYEKRLNELNELVEINKNEINVSKEKIEENKSKIDGHHEKIKKNREHIDLNQQIPSKLRD